LLKGWLAGRDLAIKEELRLLEARTAKLKLESSDMGRELSPKKQKQKQKEE